MKHTTTNIDPYTIIINNRNVIRIQEEHRVQHIKERNGKPQPEPKETSEKIQNII